MLCIRRTDCCGSVVFIQSGFRTSSATGPPFFLPCFARPAAVHIVFAPRVDCYLVPAGYVLTSLGLNYSLERNKTERLVRSSSRTTYLHHIVSLRIATLLLQQYFYRSKQSVRKYVYVFFCTNIHTKNILIFWDILVLCPVVFFHRLVSKKSSCPKISTAVQVVVALHPSTRIVRLRS